MEKITLEARRVVRKLLEESGLSAGSIFLVGCSTSEVVGKTIGKGSDIDAAAAILDGIYPVLQSEGIYLAAQCCEHLNRAIVLEREAADRYGYTPVCAVPQPKAGGSFATAVYRRLREPVVVEGVRAHAGIDIGGTLIGMHLREVAVPVRLPFDTIGQARFLCAKTRPKYIGGERAVYK